MDRLGKRILVIPDTQVKPGVNTEHLRDISRYIEHKRPDVVVHIGDHWDMPSLSSYDKGRREFEGRRYTKDIAAGNEAMEVLLGEFDYEPDMHFFIGNHEQRIERATQSSAELEGVIGYKDLNLGAWQVHDFLEIHKIQGISFSHYFTSGLYGRPVASAAVMLREVQGSAIMGHTQKVDIAIHPKTGAIAMMVGVCYTHNESYLGPQGNGCRRQVVMLNECRNGRFDPMFVSLDYLKRTYR